MRIADHVQEQNSELRAEVKELKSGLGDVTAIVQTLRTDLASRDTPTLNHTHLGKLDSLAKADSERATAVQHLGKELANVQGDLEGLKKKAKQGLALVHQDGTSSLQSVGGRDVQRDFPSSQLQSREPMRSAG